MIRIGILGCGRVARRHVEIFRDEIQNAKVTVVCDQVKERADQRAQELGAQALYSSDEFFSRKDFDLVVILTESGNHFAHTCQAIEAGKHVIVEKPAALFPDQILEAESRAIRKGLLYAPIFQNRFNPAMRQLKQTVESGRFGRLVLATIRLRWCRHQEYYEDGWHGTWAMDGGVICQQAIHHIDALQWICGLPREVVASQAQALNRLEAEDTTVALARFSSGISGVIETTTAARPEDFEASISLIGEHGMAVVGGIALNRIETWKFTSPQPNDAEIPHQCSQTVPDGYGLSHGPFVQEILNRLQEGVLVPPITGEQAAGSLRIVHALYKSQEENRWVALDSNPLSRNLGRNDQHA
jgi:predicted dehydrogenase